VSGPPFYSRLSDPLVRYICRSDCSPLMPALVGWRRRTLSPPASPVPNAEAGPRKDIAASRPSTWSRWWSRNRTIPNDTESSPDRPVRLSETSKAHVQRPSLDHTESAPANTVSGSSRTSRGSILIFLSDYTWFAAGYSSTCRCSFPFRTARQRR
jgi:hypothetical protein